eukprot:6196276-Pleurochrysis_carterae.AAC.2
MSQEGNSEDCPHASSRVKSDRQFDGVLRGFGRCHLLHARCCLRPVGMAIFIPSYCDLAADPAA